MIANAARDPEVGAAPTYFFRSAREGLRHFLAGQHGESSRVLLPAFIGQSAREGSGVLDPVRELGLEPLFYRINDDVTADARDFEQQLHDQRPSVAVLIQYYGRTDPSSARLARACLRAGVPLIEDAAHGLFSALRSSSSLGSHGDVVLYSLHKMLPLPFGGMLTVRNPVLAVDCVSSHPELATKVLGYDMRQLGEIRRNNFRRGVELLAASPLRGKAYALPWTDLGEDVPQTVPILLESVNRDDLYFALNAAGVGVVSLYHTLVEEIGPSFPKSQHLSARIINLPVHQDLTAGDVERAIQSFLSAVEERSVV